MDGSKAQESQPSLGNIIVAGCTRQKLATQASAPALDLYQGGCMPNLRDRLRRHARLRRQVYILSAKHGLVGADQPLLPYDLMLTADRAAELRASVMHTLSDRFEVFGMPDEMLLILEPRYLVPLADLLAIAGRPRLRWISDDRDWVEVSAVLDEWGWP